MIEVEKKFILTAEQEKNLLEGAEFLGEKSFTDSYYDTADYSLGIKDLWLRMRDGKFELKVPLNAAIEDRVTDQYRELETEREIADFLHLPNDKSLKDVLEENGYKPFSTMTTTRRKYKKDGYSIDLDSVDFGYRVAEIESMVETEADIEEATRNIVAYAEKLGLENSKFTRGKLAIYLKQYRPPHFQALIDAKVIR